MNLARYKEEDFNVFLEELLQQVHFDDPKESGIIKKVIDDGYDSLSKKQQYVFNQAIDEYLTEECTLCGNDICWTEMLYAYDNGGYCSGCRNTLDKND